MKHKCWSFACLPSSMPCTSPASTLQITVSCKLPVLHPTASVLEVTQNYSSFVSKVLYAPWRLPRAQEARKTPPEARP